MRAANRPRRCLPQRRRSTRLEQRVRQVLTFYFSILTFFADNEPEPKRKTLAERAGEHRSIPAPISRPVVKGTSLAGVARNTSFSSSVSSHSRTPSVSSRNTSNGSFTSSVGPGIRPKSAYGSRPQTSMAFAQSTSTRPTSSAMARPATSMESHSEEEDLPSQGKRKGMPPHPELSSSFQSSSQGYSTLQPKKLRASKSIHTVRSPRSVGNMRDASVSTAMRMLYIGEEQPNPYKEHQAISPAMKPPTNSSLRHKPSISTGLRNLRIDSAESALVLFQECGDCSAAPKTPSQIPVPCKTLAPPATPVTPCKTPRTSPPKPQYLTKGSNIESFSAWDVRGRLEDMEAMYSELKEKFSGTNIERNGLEEAVGLFKARSRFSLFNLPQRKLTETQLPNSNSSGPNSSPRIRLYRTI